MGVQARADPEGEIMQRSKKKSNEELLGEEIIRHDTYAKMP